MSEISISLGCYLFLQCSLLVIKYGFEKQLPLWVLWFPSIVLSILIAIPLIIFLIAIIIYLIVELIDYILS
jgi:hypothetical protein